MNTWRSPSWLGKPVNKLERAANVSKEVSTKINPTKYFVGSYQSTHK